jgi:hypothetical protein
MSQLLGTNIIAPIVPGSTDDTFPTHIDLYGKGGYRAVSGINDLYDIPEERTSQGMMVQTYGDGKFWIYDETIGWFELPFRAGDPRIEADKIVYITGNQTISGNKSFVNYDDTNFYGRTRAISGLFFNVYANDFLYVAPREKEYNPKYGTPLCNYSWCSIPEDEQADPDLPFDVRRKLTGTNLGYVSGGRTTIRIGEGFSAGAKYPIYTMWIGKTGIGPGGSGYEVCYSTRSFSKSLIRPNSRYYARIRGVESYLGETGLFDDESININQTNINGESISELEQIQSIAPVRFSNINNGGDAGNPDNYSSPVVLMLFSSSAPRLTLRDHYQRNFRLFRVVDKGSSWITGLNLAWKPFQEHLFTGEEYYPEYQLLTGSGIGLNGANGSKLFYNNSASFRTSGLYNIKEKITWNLFFSGTIRGFRGDYDIDPWTGRVDTEVYPVLKRYWGTSEQETLTADQITGLLSGEYAFDPRQIGVSAKTFYPTGEYIYFAWPADSGFNNIDFFKDYSRSKNIRSVPNGYKFYIDGQETNFNRTTITGIKNKANYQEDYYLFRNNWLAYNTETRVEVEASI